MGDTPHRSADAGTGGSGVTTVTTGPPVPRRGGRRHQPTPAPGRTPGWAAAARCRGGRAFGAERASAASPWPPAPMVLVIIVGHRGLPDRQGGARARRQHRELLHLRRLVPQRRAAAVRHRARWPSAPCSARSSPCSSRCRSRSGIALYLSHYAPRRLATPLGFLIDLLAAVPSVVFGLWGRDVFLQPGPGLLRLAERLLRLDPALRRRRPVRPVDPARRLVLAIMVLPIITSLSREVFLQTPRPTRRRRSPWAPPGGR